MRNETILLDIEDRIATVTLNRSHSGNRINEEMVFHLRDVCSQVEQDDDIWVVVLTGGGDFFCQGTDASTLNRKEHRFEDLTRLKIASRLAAVGKPVIAALNGDAVDQGLELALACDLRIASSEAQFGMTHLKCGMMPWDGGTQRLPRLLGRGWGMEMMLTSRVVDAHEALMIGLVNQVVESSEVVPRAMGIASTITNYGPIAVRYVKEAVMEGLDLMIDQGLRLEGDLNLILQSTLDRAEGLQSFLHRRTPEYRGK